MSNRTFKLLDNENATMFAGIPGRDDAATGREFTMVKVWGNAVTPLGYNGSKTEVITGSSKEVAIQTQAVLELRSKLQNQFIVPMATL